MQRIEFGVVKFLQKKTALETSKAVYTILFMNV